MAEGPDRPLMILQRSPLERRFLVYVRCGKNSLVESWFIQGGNRDWDLIMSFYEETEILGRELMPHKLRDRTVYIGGKSKFSSFSQLVKDGEIGLDKYDAIMFLDDDIHIDFRNINKLFKIFVDHNMGLAQPALDHSSFSSWDITLRCPSFLIRFTNFVEVMMPIMSKRTLKICWETFDLSISGWGLDFVWPKLLGDGTKRIGIIDAISSNHTQKVDLSGGRFYNYLATLGIEPMKESLMLTERYGLSGEDRRPVVHGAITLDGRELVPLLPANVGSTS